MNDPFRVLGLSRAATADDIRRARRDLAKLHHPDTGGDAEMMRQVNAAAGQALHALQDTAGDVEPGRTPGTQESAREQRGTPSSTGPSSSRSGMRRDVPSFTVEALPVETYEALLVVASWIGEVLDDDPPYLLEVHLYQPTECWCRLDLVPDAGASTVSITVAGSADQEPPSIEAVRDLWVDQLNRYDWS